ncbi:hypothetical protein ML378_26315, partial [Escherichia coli]|nr:hypothetical protein [Escherichia coli]
PLSLAECRAIGKSIAKYTHRNFTPETFAQYVADTHTPEIQAANHADYIERKEKYRDRQDLEYSAHGNMPEWARDNPSHFWQ